MEPLCLVDLKNIVDLAMKLIATPSVSGEEHDLIDWLEKYFKKIGLTDIQRFHVDEAADSLIGWVHGSPNGATVMLNFHVDTFNAFEGWETQPFKPVVKNNRIYGLGAHDMKGGAACLLSAVEAIIKSGVKLGGSILVSATTDEENWSRGIHTLIKNGVLKGVDYCIVPEQSAPATITIGQLGRHVFTVEFFGKAVHAVFEGGVNAVTDACKVAIELSNFGDKELGYMPEYGKKGSICVTGLKGGGTDILVPEYAVLWIDRHILPNQTVEQAAEQINAAIKKACIYSRYKVSWDARPTPAPTSYITEPDSRLVTVVKKNLEMVSGMSVKFMVETSVADTNHIAVHGNVPTIILGPHGGNTCEANEWVEIPSLLTLTKVLINSTLELIK